MLYIFINADVLLDSHVRTGMIWYRAMPPSAGAFAGTPWLRVRYNCARSCNRQMPVRCAFNTYTVEHDSITIGAYVELRGFRRGFACGRGFYFHALAHIDCDPISIGRDFYLRAADYDRAYIFFNRNPHTS